MPPPVPPTNHSFEDLPLPEPTRRAIGLQPGTPLDDLASLSHEDARQHLTSLWSGITDPAVAALRDTLATYNVAGIWRGDDSDDLRIILGPIVSVRYGARAHLFVEPPLPAPPPVPSFLPHACASEFYRFFPRLTPHEILGHGFYAPDEFHLFHAYGYYEDADYLDKDRESRLHWKDSWVIYGDGDGTSILIQEDGEIGAFSMPEMLIVPVLSGFENLLLRAARTYRLDTSLSIYSGLLEDPKPW